MKAKTASSREASDKPVAHHSSGGHKQALVDWKLVTPLSSPHKKITPHTQQEMKLEEHLLLQTIDPLGLSLQTSQLFEVNEAHIKGQPVTHQDIQPSLSGEKGLLQHQPPTAQTRNSYMDAFIYPHLRYYPTRLCLP